MQLSDIWNTLMRFCRICMRYLTPAQARAYSKHAKAIKWPPKPEKKAKK